MSRASTIPHFMVLMLMASTARSLIKFSTSPAEQALSSAATGTPPCSRTFRKAVEIRFARGLLEQRDLTAVVAERLELSERFFGAQAGVGVEHQARAGRRQDDRAQACAIVIERRAADLDLERGEARGHGACCRAARLLRAARGDRHVTHELGLRAAEERPERGARATAQRVEQCALERGERRGRAAQAVLGDHRRGPPAQRIQTDQRRAGALERA